MGVEKGGVQTMIKETYKNVLAYPMLNKERLRTELSVLYERKEFHQISETLYLHQIITSSGLQNSLSEVYCLLKIYSQHL
jgi:hypothetical protein